MKITKRWLQQKEACSDGIEWVVNNCKDGQAIDVIRLLMHHKLNWANWLIVRVMTRSQSLAYAIYAAECVIDIYEKRYPNNNKPRLAINTAKKVLTEDTKKNRAAAYAAAAANAAAYAAANAAADAVAAANAAADAAAAANAAAAAADAADAAAASASAAYAAAADAADAAANAAASAAAAYAADDVAYYDAKRQMKIKILNYGLSLL